jgi:hypothetical protein
MIIIRLHRYWIKPLNLAFIGAIIGQSDFMETMQNLSVNFVAGKRPESFGLLMKITTKL